MLLAFSCKKESSPFSALPDSGFTKSVLSRSDCDAFALTSTEIQVLNGRFYFPTYELLEQTMTSLESLSENEEVNASALLSLGFLDEDDEFAPEEPALKIFNNRFSIYSLRQHLEDVENNIDLGLLEEDEIDKIIIWDPALGSIINQDHEIQIGNLIYKYIDDDQTLVFKAGAQTENIVKNAANLYEIPRQFNIFKIDQRKPEDVALYEKLEAANKGGECLFDIVWSNDGAYFFFHAFGSFPPTGSVVWNILDGNGQVLATQNGLSTFNFEIPLGAVYPLSVSIGSAGCDAHVEVFAASNPNSGYNCETFDFQYEFTENAQQNAVRFIIPPNTPAVHWDFGPNTSSLNTPPTGTVGGSFIKYFADDDEVEHTVCATVQTEICTKTVCKTIGYLGCGEKQNFRFWDRLYYGPSTPSEGRIKGRFALKNPLFAKSKLVIKLKHATLLDGGSFIFYIRAKADRLQLDLNAFPHTNVSDLRYFNPTSILGCEQVEQTATKTVFNKRKLKGTRELSKNATMRKSDALVILTGSDTFEGTNLPFSMELGYDAQ